MPRNWAAPARKTRECLLEASVWAAESAWRRVRRRPLEISSRTRPLGLVLWRRLPEKGRWGRRGGGARAAGGRGPQDTPSRVTAVPAHGGPLEISSQPLLFLSPYKVSLFFFEAFIPGSALPFRDPFLERVVETEVLLRLVISPHSGALTPGLPQSPRMAAFLPSRAPVLLSPRCA